MAREPKELYETALNYYGDGKLNAAAALFEEILQLDPKHTEAYEALGQTYYRLNRLDDAVRCMLKLVELKPDHAMAHTNLSVYYMKMGLKDRAEEEKAKATVLNFGKTGKKP